MAGQRQKPANTTQGHRTVRSLMVVPDGDSEVEIPPLPLAMDGAPMLARAAERWRDFWLSDVANVVDQHTDMERLERWIQCVNERAIVTTVIAKGRLVKGSQGQPRPNPLIGYVNRLTEEIERCERDFGMTPLSRFRLGIEYAEAGSAIEQMNAELADVSHAEPIPAEFDD